MRAAIQSTNTSVTGLREPHQYSGDDTEAAGDGAECSFRYKGREIDPQAIGRELNVRALLVGRMMQSGGSLRIGAELVDVATGSLLWARNTIASLATSLWSRTKFPTRYRGNYGFG